MACLSRCRFLLLLAFTIVLQVAPATAATPTSKRTDVTWLYPDPSQTPVYNAVDILNATWTSNFTGDPILIMWCKSDGSTTWDARINYTVPSSGNRLIPLTVRGSYPAGCHLDFENPDGSDAKGHTISGHFNITNEPDSKPVTWSLHTNPAPVSPSVSASASAGANNASSATSTALPSPASSGSHLSGGAIAGIVIGGVFALALLGFLWFIIQRRRQARKTEILPMHKLYPMYGDDTSNKTTGMTNTEARVAGKDADDVRHEMVGETEAPPTVELDASSEVVAPTAGLSRGSPRNSMKNHSRSISLSSNGGDVDIHSTMLHPHGPTAARVSRNMEDS